MAKNGAISYRKTAKQAIRNGNNRQDRFKRETGESHVFFRHLLLFEKVFWLGFRFRVSGTQFMKPEH